MIAALKSPLRREIVAAGSKYVVTISPAGLKLALKGRRNGYEVEWGSLVNGDAALAAALNASLAAPLVPKPKPAAGRKQPVRRRARSASRH